jgi:hypothetical protein
VTGTSRSRQVIESITQAAQRADEVPQKPITPDSAPAKVDRSWEARHPAIPVRLDAEDAEWFREFAESQGVTLDAAGRGLMRAIHYAIDKGLVSFTRQQGVEAYTDKAGRQRNRAQVELLHHWQIPRS